MTVNASVKKFLQRIGSKGGKVSKRVLTTEQAKGMVAIREKKRAEKAGK